MAQKFPNSDGSKEEVLLPAFQRLQRGLRRLASSMVGESVAEDALQDAFIRLWTRRTTLRSEDEAGRLLTTTVKHLSIDHLRQQQREASVSLTEADGAEEDAPDVESRFQAVERIVASELSPLQRDILRRHDYEGQDYDAIAQSLQMQPAAVRMQLSRARRTIREIYRRDYEDE